MATSAVTRRLVGKLSSNNCAMLLCDMQERLIPHICNAQTIIQTTKLLTSVAKELQMPLVVTEQYPKALGRTSKDCFEDETHMAATPAFEKKLFSMLAPNVSEHISSLGVTSFILFGIEAHVCVQQTALDLLEVRQILSNMELRGVVSVCSSTSC